MYQHMVSGNDQVAAFDEVLAYLSMASIPHNICSAYCRKGTMQEGPYSVALRNTANEGKKRRESH